MHPHHYPSHNPDLDAAMSRLGMGSRWSPDRSPASSWQAPSTLSASYNDSPTGHSHHPPADLFSARLSPSSSSSLTDRDISRRTLAASGLDVSAPEFIPSFVKAPPPPSPPLHSPPRYHRAASPTAFPQLPALSPAHFEPSIPRSPPLYETIPSPQSSFFHPAHPQPHVMPHIHQYHNNQNSYLHSPDQDPYFPASPQHSGRPSHLDETTYVSAVQHFDEEFPALAKHETNSRNSATANGRWSTDQDKPSHNHQQPVKVVQAIYPKALGWNAMQREQERKKLEAEATRRWQAELNEYFQNADHEYDDVYDEEIHVSDDIGALWVSTGQSVGHMYQSIRAKAAEEARLRNKYFDRAAAAFKKNDGATAKRLGALGREANERMKELHRQAAQAIFKARNPRHVLDVVDLHGLHVSEALERLPLALEKAPPGILRIVTGTGHHTKGTGRARLRPAVKTWLQENGYFFEEVVDANEFVGSFKVEIVR